jgi:hypothetical protein
MSLATLLAPPTQANLSGWQFEHAMQHRFLLGAMAAEIPSGLITGATITNGGTGYTSAPTVTINTQTGSGAVLQAVVTQPAPPAPPGAPVAHINVIANGSNYAATDTVTISGGGGTGATATLELGSLVGSFFASGGLSGFSAVPYMIDPQQNLGPWHLDHNQAHQDFQFTLPGFFGSTVHGRLATQDYVDMNFQNQSLMQWWVFANEQQHRIGLSVLPRQLVTFPW